MITTPRRAALAAGIALAIAPHALATTEFLSMDSLPGASGWTYQTSGVTRPEGVTASVSGGVLTFNTMGSGHQPGGSSIFYGKTITPDWTQSWLIEADVRLNAFESFSNFHGVYFGASVLWVGVSPTRLTFPDLTFVAYAPGTNFHTYRFEVQTNEAWTFYADNVPLKTGVLGVGSGPLALRIGDGTGGSNGSASYDAYRFAQPIPAPGWGVVGLVGYSGFTTTRRRRVAA
ncbi:MAG: hypothetical protein IPK69_05315 [Phycisphaerales bacterium]|nr:MAG: hypothetical protein IPK69_05315 [Phycisphaerales bacterium]